MQQAGRWESPTVSGHYAWAGLASGPEESGGGGEVVPEVILAVLWPLAVVAARGGWGIGRRWEENRHHSCLGRYGQVLW